eukprot:6204100-Pleurochrysis_carterae.AAC.2
MHVHTSRTFAPTHAPTSPRHFEPTHAHARLRTGTRMHGIRMHVRTCARMQVSVCRGARAHASEGVAVVSRGRAGLHFLESRAGRGVRGQAGQRDEPENLHGPGSAGPARLRRLKRCKLGRGRKHSQREECGPFLGRCTALGAVATFMFGGGATGSQDVLASEGRVGRGGDCESARGRTREALLAIVFSVHNIEWEFDLFGYASAWRDAVLRAPRGGGKEL